MKQVLEQSVQVDVISKIRKLRIKYKTEVTEVRKAAMLSDIERGAVSLFSGFIGKCVTDPGLVLDIMGLFPTASILVGQGMKITGIIGTEQDTTETGIPITSQFTGLPVCLDERIYSPVQEYMKGNYKPLENSGLGISTMEIMNALELTVKRSLSDDEICRIVEIHNERRGKNIVVERKRKYRDIRTTLADVRLSAIKRRENGRGKGLDGFIGNYAFAPEVLTDVYKLFGPVFILLDSEYRIMDVSVHNKGIDIILQVTAEPRDPKFANSSEYLYSPGGDWSVDTKTVEGKVHVMAEAYMNGDKAPLIESGMTHCLLDVLFMLSFGLGRTLTDREIEEVMETCPEELDKEFGE